MRYILYLCTIRMVLIVMACGGSDTEKKGWEYDTQEWVMKKYDVKEPYAEPSNADDEKVQVVKPMESYYERGYDVGYDNGKEDGDMDLGDGYSYNDSNPYSGQQKHDFERGYRDGYREGYKEGFYDYAEGDEEMYDEYE